MLQKNNNLILGNRRGHIINKTLGKPQRSHHQQNAKERNASIKLKMKHDKKLSRLLGSKSSEHSDSNLKNRWVINLSSKELTELERKGLEHGLNFAIAPNRIPTAEIVASVEEAIFRQSDETKQTVRAEVSSILRRAKTPPRNIDSNVFKA